MRFAARLGYSLVGVERSDRIDWEKVRSAAGELGISARGVFVASGATRAEMRKALEEGRGRGDLVLAVPKSLDALRYSSVRKEVHMIRVVRGMEKHIDASQARLFSNRGWGAVEVSLSELWRPGGIQFAYEILRRAHELDLDVVITSGASSAEELWDPEAIVGLISSFSIPSLKALSWITSVPARIAELPSLL